MLPPAGSQNTVLNNYPEALALAKPMGWGGAFTHQRAGLFQSSKHLASSLQSTAAELPTKTKRKATTENRKRKSSMTKNKTAYLVTG